MNCHVSIAHLQQALTFSLSCFTWLTALYIRSILCHYLGVRSGLPDVVTSQFLTISFHSRCSHLSSVVAVESLGKETNRDYNKDFWIACCNFDYPVFWNFQYLKGLWTERQISAISFSLFLFHLSFIACLSWAEAVQKNKLWFGCFTIKFFVSSLKDLTVMVVHLSFIAHVGRPCGLEGDQTQALESGGTGFKSQLQQLPAVQP